LQLSWSLNVTWLTPDRNPANPPNATRPFRQPAFNVKDQQEVTFTLDSNADPAAQRLVGVSNGQMAGAFTTAPPLLTFPEAGRRTPLVAISETGALTQRAWDRHGATAQQSLVIEWQPIFTVDGTATGQPIMRGGNVVLGVATMAIDGIPVAPGVEFPRPTARGARPARHPATDPVAMLPLFRIHGLNPPVSDLDALVDLLVTEVFTNNLAANLHLSFVGLADWKKAARRVVTHETAGKQFATRPPAPNVGAISIPLVTPNRTYAHGKERDMPLFGAPHGYGVGQLDPPDNADQLWSLEAAALECVRRLLIDKGSRAVTVLGREFNTTSAATLTRRSRNVFLRETVRQYNGGTEFRFDASTSDWVVKPSVGNPRIFYPDAVLGTTMLYERLISAPNDREPAPASHGRLDTELQYTSAHFVL
jgi:hypothetical protein